MANTDVIENAQITNTFLGREDHGIFTFVITVSGESWGQGFGTFALDYYDKKTDKRMGWNNAIPLIASILDAVGVESWEELKDKYCRVKREGEWGYIRAIGHPVKNKWADTRDFIDGEKP